MCSSFGFQLKIRFEILKVRFVTKKKRTWNLRLITDFYLHFLSSRFNLKQFSPDFCCYTDVKQARHSMIEGTSSNLLFFLKCQFLFGLSYCNIKYERASFQDGQRRAACCAPQKSGKGFAEAYSDIIHGPGRSSCTVWGPAVVCWNSAPDIFPRKDKNRPTLASQSQMKGSYFILGGLNYCVLTFKLIIWYNALIVYMHVLTLYSYLKKYLY